jgi:hypothetical protein
MKEDAVMMPLATDSDDDEVTRSDPENNSGRIRRLRRRQRNDKEAARTKLKSNPFSGSPLHPTTARCSIIALERRIQSFQMFGVTNSKRKMWTLWNITFTTDTSARRGDHDYDQR